MRGDQFLPTRRVTKRDTLDGAGAGVVKEHTVDDMHNTVGGIDVGDDDVARGDTRVDGDGDSCALDIKGQGLAGKGGDDGTIGHLLSVDLTRDDVEEKDTLQGLDVVEEASEDLAGDSSERLVRGGEDDIGAVGVGQGRDQAGSSDCLDQGGKGGDSNGGVDNVVLGNIDVGGHEHAVNDLDDTVAGKDVEGGDAGVVDTGGGARAGDLEAEISVARRIEGGDLLARAEGRAGEGSGGNVVVEGGQEVLLVVLVEDPGGRGVAELGEGVVGGGEDSLESGSAQEIRNASYE